jgi:chromosome segregation ATPase
MFECNGCKASALWDCSCPIIKPSVCGYCGDAIYTVQDLAAHQCEGLAKAAQRLSPAGGLSAEREAAIRNYANQERYLGPIGIHHLSEMLAEIDRVRAERDEWKQAHLESWGDVGKQRERADKAEAELAQYRDDMAALYRDVDKERNELRAERDQLRGQRDKYEEMMIAESRNATKAEEERDQLAKANEAFAMRIARLREALRNSCDEFDLCNRVPDECNPCIALAADDKEAGK